MVLRNQWYKKPIILYLLFSTLACYQPTTKSFSKTSYWQTSCEGVLSESDATSPVNWETTSLPQINPHLTFSSFVFTEAFDTENMFAIEPLLHCHQTYVKDVYETHSPVGNLFLYVGRIKFWGRLVFQYASLHHWLYLLNAFRVRHYQLPSLFPNMHVGVTFYIVVLSDADEYQ